MNRNRNFARFVNRSRKNSDTIRSLLQISSTTGAHAKSLISRAAFSQSSASPSICNTTRQCSAAHIAHTRALFRVRVVVVRRARHFHASARKTRTQSNNICFGFFDLQSHGTCVSCCALCSPFRRHKSCCWLAGWIGMHAQHAAHSTHSGWHREVGHRDLPTHSHANAHLRLRQALHTHTRCCLRMQACAMYAPVLVYSSPCTPYVLEHRRDPFFPSTKRLHCTAVGFVAVAAAVVAQRRLCTKLLAFVSVNSRGGPFGMAISQAIY